MWVSQSLGLYRPLVTQTPLFDSCLSAQSPCHLVISEKQKQNMSNIHQERVMVVLELERNTRKIHLGLM